MLVNFVGQNENALGQSPFADGAGFLFGVDGTGRVGGETKMSALVAGVWLLRARSTVTL